MLPSGTRGLRDSFAEPVPGTVLSEKQNLRECRGIGLRTGPRPYAVWVPGRSLRGAAASVWRDRPSGRRAGSGWGRGRTDWNPLSSLTSCKPSDMGDQLEKLTPVPQSCARLAQDSDPQGRRPRDCRSGSEARPAVGRCVPPPHLAPHADLRSVRAAAAALPARWPAPTQNRPRQGILGAGAAALLSPYRRQPPPFTSGRFGVLHTSPSQIKTGAEPWPSVTGLSFRLRDGKRPAAPTMLGVSRTLPGESLQLRR